MAGRKKADIELLFGMAGGGSLSGESGKLIQEQLTELVADLNKNTSGRKLKFGVDKKLSKPEIKRGIQDLVDSFTSGDALPLKIGKIDASDAIKDVKKQLESMLKALSVSNGVNITGIKDLIGTPDVGDADKVAKSAEQTADEMREASERTAKFTSQMKQLDTVAASVKKSISSASGGKNILDKDELAAAQKQYTELLDEIEKLRAGNVVDDSARQRLIELGDQISRNIALRQQEKEAARKVAEEEEKARRQAQQRAERQAEADARAAQRSEERMVNLKQVSALYDQIGSFLNGNTANIKSEDADKLREYREELGKLIVDAKNAGDVLEVMTRVDLDGIASNFAAIRSGVRDADESLDRHFTTLKQVSTLYNQIGQYLEINTGIDSADRVELEAMRKKLKEVADEAERTGTSLTAMNKLDLARMQSHFTKLRSKIKDAKQETQGFVSQIKNVLIQFGGMSLVMDAFRETIQLVRKMVDVVISVDTAMTELKKVTEETDATYDRFLTKATSRAKDLGATLTDTVNATADFARLGYDIGDASALADAAIVYKNVGDGLENITDASESIISTMQAFGVAANDAMTIVDKFNITGNNFAISSKGVGDALMRSASAMAAAGNTLDETIALTAAANEVVQNPEKVGTTLKTVSMYLRAAKVEAEEAGESTDGMANSVSELREQILALTGQRVDIMIDDSTFKSTYNIMRELSKVYGSMADTSRATLLELIGGKRNSNVVAALLNNFSTAEEVIQNTANSAGSAMAENEKYLDSIAGKIAIFEAQAEDLSGALIDGGFLGDIVDFGTDALEVLTNLVEKFGALPTVIAAVTTSISTMMAIGGKRSGLFNIDDKGVDFAGIHLDGITSRFVKAHNEGASIKQAISMIANDMDVDHIVSLIDKYNSSLGNNGGATEATDNFLKILKETDVASHEFFSGLSGGVATLGNYCNSVKMTGSAIGGLGKTLASLAMNIGLELALSAVVSWITESIQKAKEAREAKIEDGKAAIQTSENIVSLANAYNELSAATYDSGEAALEARSARDDLIEGLGLETEKVKGLIAEYGSLEAAIKEATIQRLKDEHLNVVVGLETQGGETLKDVKGKEDVEFYETEENSAAYRALTAAGLTQGSYAINGGGVGVRYLPLEEINTIEDAIEQRNTLTEMVRVLSETENTDNALFTKLAERKSWLDKQLSEYIEMAEASNRGLASIAALEYDDIAPERIDERDSDEVVREKVAQFKEYRQKIIDELSSNSEFVDTGASIESIVDNQLKANDIYADYIDRISQAEYEMTERVTQRQKMISGLAANSVDELSSNSQVYKEALELAEQEAESFVNSLSDTDLQKAYAAYEADPDTFGWHTMLNAVNENYDRIVKLRNELSGLNNDLKAIGDTGGTVDLFNRPSVKVTGDNIDTVRGWGMDGKIGDVMTVTSQTYDDGNAAIVVTPILPNGELLEQDELEKYVQDIISKTSNGDYAANDTLGIVMGVFDDAGDLEANIAAADEYAVKVRELHEGILEVQGELERAQDTQVVTLSGKSTLEDLDKNLSEVADIYNLINTANEEMNKTGRVSQSTIAALADVTGDYTGYLTEENGVVVLNTEALEALAEAKRAAAVANTQNDILYYQKQNDDIQHQIDLLKEQRALYERDHGKDSYDSGGFDKQMAEYEAQIESNEVEIDKLNNLLSIMETSFEAAGETVEEVEDDLGSFEDAIESIAGTVSGVGSSIAEINDVIAEYGDVTKLTEQQTLELVGKFPSLISQLVQTENGYRLNAGALEGLRTAEVAEAQNMIQAEAAKARSIIESTGAIGRALSAQMDSFSTTAEFYAAYANALGGAQGVAAKGLDPERFNYAEGTYTLSDNSKYDISNSKTLMDMARNIEMYKRIDAANKAIEKLNNIDFSGFSGTGGLSSGGGGGSAIEAYTVDIEQFREAIERLDRVQKEREGIETDISNSDSLQEQIALTKNLTAVQTNEIAVQKQLNELRSGAIAANAEQLRALGFEVSYNSETNELWINNLERLNSITATSIGNYSSMQEATNALREETEELINSMNSMNEENISGANNWKTLQKSVDDSTDSIRSLLDEIVAEASSAVDSIQSVYDTLHAAADEYAESGYITVDTLQSIIGMGAQYMTYLQDENGQLVINEERIQAVIAARTEQMAVESAMSYVQSLKLALENNEVDTLNNLLYATTEATSATWGLVYASLALMGLDSQQYQAALNNVNALRSLSQQAVTSISQAGNGAAEAAKEAAQRELDELNDMKEGVDDLLDYVMDMVQDNVEREIDALEDVKDRYSDIIDAKKESLELAEEEADRAKEQSKQIKEIAKLQEKIDALSLDDSRSAQAERAGLLEQMAELQEELADEQLDYAVDSQKDALDQQKEAFEEEKDREIEILKDSVSSTQKIYDMAIDYINNNWNSLYDDLIAWNTSYGNSLNSEISSAWDSALAAAQRYGSYTEALKHIDTDISAAEDAVNAHNNSGSSFNTVIGSTVEDSSFSDADAVRVIVADMKALSRAWSPNNSKEQNQKLHDQAAAKAGQLPQYGVFVDYNSADGTWTITRDEINPSNAGKLLYSVYHGGGIAGDNSTLEQDEVMAVLKKGEAVLDAERQNNLFRLVEFATTMKDKFSRMLGTFDLSNVFSHATRGVEPVNNIVNNQRETIHFGDVYIYGGSEETVAKHREVNREFANEIVKQLNIKR